MERNETIESMERALAHERDKLINLAVDTEPLELRASVSRRRLERLQGTVQSMEHRLTELRELAHRESVS